MQTAVVSGRIDSDIKRKVDAIIRNAGSSVSEVIGNVWATIVKTGELPATPYDVDELKEQRARYVRFEKWLSELPEPNPSYAHMTDDEILATRMNRYV